MDSTLVVKPRVEWLLGRTLPGVAGLGFLVLDRRRSVGRGSVVDRSRSTFYRRCRREVLLD